MLKCIYLSTYVYIYIYIYMCVCVCVCVCELLLLSTPFRVFHTSTSWWFFIRVWVATSLPMSTENLLSILAVLNNVVVWMVSTHPPTSKSASPFYNTLMIVPLVWLSPLCSAVLSIPKLGPGSYFYFHCLLILFCGQSGQQSLQLGKFSFFVDYFKVWSSGRD